MPTKATLCLVLICGTAVSSASAQSQNAPVNQQIRSQVREVGTAQVRSLTPSSGFYPSLQPEVYWHDSDWKIDLVKPAALGEPYELSIRSSSGGGSLVKLPQEFEQINSILRAPANKAIVVEYNHTGSGGFAIVDLNGGKLLDEVGVEFSVISPNRRFILYQNWYPNETESYENMYRLYDTLRTPTENTCGYQENDPKHQQLNDDLRGFQVYPQKPGQVLCTDEDDSNDNVGTNFTWSPDSSKIVFADVKSGMMSLILVTMPVGTSDLPKTSTYPLVGFENVCAGATDAAGQPYCDYHVIQSLGWNGDAVTATLHHQFGTPLDLTLTIPVSKFIPIGK